MDLTKNVTALRISAAEAEAIRKADFTEVFGDTVKDWQQKLDRLCQYVDQLIGAAGKIYMGNKKVWYLPCVVSVLPDVDIFLPDSQQRVQNWIYGQGWHNSFAGFDGDLPTVNEVNRFYCTARLYQNAADMYLRCGKSNSQYYGLLAWDGTKIVAYGACNNAYFDLGSTSGANGWEQHALIPIFRLHGKDSNRVAAHETVLLWLEHGLVPSITWFDHHTYQWMQSLYANNKEYFVLNEDPTRETLLLDTGKILADCAAGKVPQFLRNAFEKYLRRRYLQADTVRASLDAYDDQMLTDINRGHWELWDAEQANGAGAGDVKSLDFALQEPLVARDAHGDIQSGTVAIDFGTKSTVVVYGDGAINNLPLQVGNGNYAGSNIKDKYENPTVIHFIDLDAFTAAYRARAGRPFTNWQDMVVSHKAFANMSVNGSSGYGSFMDNLKQWCGMPDLQVKIKDCRGQLLELPSFMQLQESDFNPVEIYAYYIGLFINNMRGKPKIYKRYVMSFPVTFEKELKKKILASFKKGLLKSLPMALAGDEKFVADFTVEEGASEPAAYAAIALEMTKLEPDEEEGIHYGVFDFGGGTTDFDFGVYGYGDEDSRYDYELVHFGANGDRTLGGENLLRNLAFAIFKHNKEILRGMRVSAEEDTPVSYKVPFNYDADFTEFIGCRDYIEDSHAANQNMHILMEKLRPVWEDPQSAAAKALVGSGNRGFAVDLVDADNSPLPNCRLYLGKVGKLFVPKKQEMVCEEQGDVAGQLDLPQMIRDRIAAGVYKFFLTMKEAYAKNGADERIHSLEETGEFTIFLAGNSSKAQVVLDVFGDYVGKDGKATEKLQQILGSGNLPKFRIEPPLGLGSTDYEKPNGKTGVAFGLLKCRKQGTDVKVVDITANGDEISLHYYVGRIRRKKFQVYLSPTSKLREWVKFIDAGGDFEIYYTDDPAALSGSATKDVAQGMQIIPVPEEERKENGFVYLQAVGPNRLLWKIAEHEDDLNKDDGKVREIELK